MGGSCEAAAQNGARTVARSFLQSAASRYHEPWADSGPADSAHPPKVDAGHWAGRPSEVSRTSRDYRNGVESRFNAEAGHTLVQLTVAIAFGLSNLLSCCSRRGCSPEIYRAAAAPSRKASNASS